MHRRRQHTSTAFTLIELLLTITIIAILVGLLAGPISRALKKARDADWTNKADVKVERLITNLRAHYLKQEITARLTPAQLRELRVIDDELFHFLNEERVRFHPFSSADDDDQIVLEVRYPKSFLSGPEHSRIIQKERITADPPGR